jgi:L-seryl-tRNA(Ser) seleniumtransferase
VYYQLGADLVIYSGAKAIEGPTSGLVLGKKRYIDWVKLQSSGIGRAMKVGKESILGLTQAIESYITLPKTTGQEMVDKMMPFIARLNALPGVSAHVVWDSAGRDIARTEVTFDEAAIGWQTKAIVDALKNGDIAIYFRGYRANEGKIEVDVRSVTPPQLETIALCIQHLLMGTKA